MEERMRSHCLGVVALCVAFIVGLSSQCAAISLDRQGNAGSAGLANAIIETTSNHVATAWTNWTNMFTGPLPPARHSHTMVYDRNDSRTLVFGGYGDTYYNDVWSYDLKAGSWKNMSPKSPPPGRIDHGAAFDSRNGCMVVFGGRDAKRIMNDTWVYEYGSNTWENASPVKSPQSRDRSGLSYDEESGRIVLFGGLVGNARYDNETWSYDAKNNTWTNLTFLSAPKGRADHALEYDSKSDRIIMFGGKTGPLDFSQETWSYNLNKNTWTNVTNGTRPGPKLGHALAYAAKTDRVIMFGGMNTNETWGFDLGGKAWTLLKPAPSPFPRSEHAMNYDAAGDRIVLFGGSNGGDEIWTYDALNNTWTNANPNPTPRFDHAMAYDSGGDRVLLFGGVVTGMSKGDDTWSYDSITNKWIGMEPSTSPSPRSSTAMAYDSESDRTILFGGSTVSGQFDNETWRYDLGSDAWARMKPALSPPKMAYHSLVYDSQSDHIVLFGGNTGTNDTWSYDLNNDTWQKMASVNAPSPRGLLAMAYDSQSDRIVLFGGNVSIGSDNETWAYDYDNDTWVEMKPALSPLAREQFAMAYDSHSDRIVLFGGKVSGGYDNETWTYDLERNTWERVMTAIAPSQRIRHAMSYDSESDRIVLFGGSDALVPRNGETWTSSPPGNNAPGAPSVSGPSVGMIDMNLTYGLKAHDPDLDDLKYIVDWGDGAKDGTGLQASGKTINVTHAWGAIGTYKVKAMAIDSRGRGSAWSSPIDVVIAPPPIPSVKSTTPANGEIDVSVSPTVVIEFSRPMDRAATEGAISSSPNLTMVSKWSQQDTVVELVFTQSLRYNTSYAITISTAAKSKDNVHLASSHSFSFKTIANKLPPDFVPQPDYALLWVLLLLLFVIVVTIVGLVLRRKRRRIVRRVRK